MDNIISYSTFMNNLVEKYDNSEQRTKDDEILIKVMSIESVEKLMKLFFLTQPKILTIDYKKIILCGYKSILKRYFSVSNIGLRIIAVEYFEHKYDQDICKEFDVEFNIDEKYLEFHNIYTNFLILINELESPDLTNASDYVIVMDNYIVHFALSILSDLYVSIGPMYCYCMIQKIYNKNLILNIICGIDNNKNIKNMYPYNNISLLIKDFNKFILF